jgi:hypothetical protein
VAAAAVAAVAAAVDLDKDRAVELEAGLAVVWVD